MTGVTWMHVVQSPLAGTMASIRDGLNGMLDRLGTVDFDVVADPVVAEINEMRDSLKKIDVSKLGPKVGERVPDFSLKDQSGKTWTLQSIMGPKGAWLVFIRSADW